MTDWTAYEEPAEALHYKLRLFVAGASVYSVRAIEQVNELCQRFLKGRCDLEIIDVHQHPQLAQTEQIVALPMLLKDGPDPRRRIIGDMSDSAKLLRVLGITTNIISG